MVPFNYSNSIAVPLSPVLDQGRTFCACFIIELNYVAVGTFDREEIHPRLLQIHRPVECRPEFPRSPLPARAEELLDNQYRLRLSNSDEAEMDDYPRAKDGDELRRVIETAVNRARNKWWTRDYSNSTWTPPVFRAEDVGYFDPDPDANHLELTETYPICHNVFAFKDRLG